jgi:TPR repeat protein
MEISMEQVEPASLTGARDALFELGMLYAAGRDVAADLVVAHKWFNLSASRGNPAALSYRIELAREMSSDQIAEAQKLAREWIRMH